MREMRLHRMRTLALEIASMLRGDRGGPVGIRFGSHERGRGIDGEGLEKPLPLDKRVIKIGVADWYRFGDSVLETVREEAADAELGDGIESLGIDQFGYRTDGVQWSTPKPLPRPVNYTREALAHLTREEQTALTIRQKKQLLDDFVRDRKREFANLQSVRHPSVIYPAPTKKGSLSEREATEKATEADA